MKLSISWPSYLTSLLTLSLVSTAVFSDDEPENTPPTELQTNTTDSPSVAILPFVSDGKTLEKLGLQISDLIHSQLSTKASLTTVEHARVDKSVSKIELGISGTVSPETAARIGHLCGANVLVTGRVFAVQNELFIVTKVSGTETGKSFGEAESFSIRANYADASRTIGDKVAKIIEEKGADFFIAREKDTETLLDTLKVLIEGKSLPTVSVAIVERHVGQTLPDRAAQTELRRLLQALEFPLVDATSTTSTPDIKIVGEAFSEFGLREGDLISCKARIEVKAVEQTTGKILTIDRETEISADISKQVANKLAMEKAGRKLGERLVLRITNALE